LITRQAAQHDAEGRFVEILGVIGSDANAHRARPIGDFGQLGAEVIEDLLRLRGVVVGDVEQAERGRASVIWQRHLRSQLRQHEAGGHLPLRMGRVTGGK